MRKKGKKGSAPPIDSEEAQEPQVPRKRGRPRGAKSHDSDQDRSDDQADAPTLDPTIDPALDPALSPAFAPALTLDAAAAAEAEEAHMTWATAPIEVADNSEVPPLPKVCASTRTTHSHSAAPARKTAVPVKRKWTSTMTKHLIAPQVVATHSLPSLVYHKPPAPALAKSTAKVRSRTVPPKKKITQIIDKSLLDDSSSVEGNFAMNIEDLDDDGGQQVPDDSNEGMHSLDLVVG